MAYEKKDDTGFLFKNKEKEKEAQPDYTGWIKTGGGEEMRLAAWIKDMKDGTKALSIKVSEKKKFQPKEQPPQGRGVSNDDIPF